MSPQRPKRIFSVVAIVTSDSTGMRALSIEVITDMKLHHTEPLSVAMSALEAFEGKPTNYSTRTTPRLTRDQGNPNLFWVAERETNPKGGTT